MALLRSSVRSRLAPPLFCYLHCNINGAELLFKSAYGWAIEKATHATYETPENNTWALVEKDGVKQIISLPRYEAFMPAASKLAKQGNTFINIAGNRKILLTVIAPTSWNYSGTGEVFTQWPILTRPSYKREALHRVARKHIIGSINHDNQRECPPTS